MLLLLHQHKLSDRILGFWHTVIYQCFRLNTAGLPESVRWGCASANRNLTLHRILTFHHHIALQSDRLQCNAQCRIFHYDFQKCFRAAKDCRFKQRILEFDCIFLSFNSFDSSWQNSWNCCRIPKYKKQVKLYATTIWQEIACPHNKKVE